MQPPDRTASRAPLVLVAPDSFKGTFSARTVSTALSLGLRRGGVQVDSCPVADGGEGTAGVLLEALGGSTQAVRSQDALGRPMSCSLALIDGGRRAIVETAEASGLAHLSGLEYDVRDATTRGTGILINAAVELGVEEILVTAGGSATVDGGRGALEAIAEGGGLRGAKLTVLCDVETSWEDCAAIYGPQKGATPEVVIQLQARLESLASSLPRDPRTIARTGAAGGLSGALLSAHGAALMSGARYVLDVVGLDRRARRARVVVTGEGRIDFQSLLGKLVGEVAARSRAVGASTYVVAGQVQLEASVAQEAGISAMLEASSLIELEEAGRMLERRGAID
jgi:glycerate kinase